MTRLTRLPPRLSPAPPRLVPTVTEAERSRRRARTEPWRAWYKLAGWCARPWGIRWRQLVADGFTCQECGEARPSPQLVCDHVHDHKGDWCRFWSGPFTTLCLSCHGRKPRTTNDPRGVV